MNLIELKDYIKYVCLSHKDIKSFTYGSDFDIAVNKKDVYPQCFLELPFIVDVNLTEPYDRIQIALNVLVAINADSIDSDWIAISYAKDIGDVIVQYINDNCSDFRIDSTNAISVREHTDDSVAGMRYDLEILFPRICVDDYEDYFKFD